MSLLQQTGTELDDAAKGEDLTRGTSHIVWATLVAVVVVSLAMWAYAVATREAPVASGTVTSATVHFVHHESSGLDAAGNPMPKEEFDQTLVFTHMQLHNQGKNPLFVRQVMTNIRLADGVHTAYAAIPSDYERFFQATPQLAALHGKPLPMQATIPPGGTMEGDFVAAFRITRADWDARKAMDYTVSYQYQPDLGLPGPASVNAQ